MIASRVTALALGLSLGIAATAQAQVQTGRFQLAAQGGWYEFDSGSGMKGGFALGADGTYYITPSLGIGVWSDYSFTETDGERFIPAEFSFIDSTTYNFVSQGVEIWQYGAHAKLQRSGPRWAPFLLVGAGGYTVFLDPQQNSGVENFTGFVARFGVGVDFAVSERAGIQISAYDAYIPSWKPERLSPIRAEFQNQRFPELNPTGELDDSAHNLRFTVALTLIPAGGL